MLFSILKVSGHSMEPTVNNSSLIIVSSIIYTFREPKIGDIVVFKKNKKILIKRIKKIKNNSYFLEGDNVNDSLDSDEFGFIEKKNILGKVLYILKY